MGNQESERSDYMKEMADAFLHQVGTRPEKKQGGEDYVAYFCNKCREKGLRVTRRSLFFYPKDGTFHCYRLVRGKTTGHEKELNESFQKWLAENE